MLWRYTTLAYGSSSNFVEVPYQTGGVGLSHQVGLVGISCCVAYRS